MNPLITILLIVLAAFALILLAAFLLSVIVVAAGKKYSRQQRQALLSEISALLAETDGDEQLAQQLLEGTAEIPQTLSEDNAEKLQQILTQWQQEQERIRLESENNRKKRKKKITDLFWQVDKPSGEEL